MGPLLVLCDALDALPSARGCLAELGFSVGDDASFGPFERHEAVVVVTPSGDWRTLLAQVTPDDFRTLVLLVQGALAASEITAAFRNGLNAVVTYNRLQEIGVGLSRCVAWLQDVEHSG